MIEESAAVMFVCKIHYSLLVGTLDCDRSRTCRFQPVCVSARTNRKSDVIKSIGKLAVLPGTAVSDQLKRPNTILLSAKEASCAVGWGRSKGAR